MAVRHELARGAARGREAEAVDDVVQTRLAELEQDVARHALARLRALEEDAELALHHAVDETGLLLLAELLAVFGQFLPAARAVLPGRVGTLLQDLVRPKECLAETAGDFRTGTSITTHFTLSCACADGIRCAERACSP